MSLLLSLNMYLLTGKSSYRYFPVNIYLFKVITEALEKDKKYVQN